MKDYEDIQKCYHHIFSESMCVKDLIETLSKFPSDKKICSTWEGTFHSLTEENVYESLWGPILLDADENFYKEDFEKKSTVIER